MCIIPTHLYNDEWRLTDAQMRYLRQIGLQNLAKIHPVTLHHQHITAFIERWRPETNTFHFNSSKTTITLKDANVIYGLLIDGDAMTSSLISTKRNVLSLYEALLGVVPVHNKDTQGSAIKFSWILSTFKDEWKDKKGKTNDMRRSSASLLSRRRSID